MGERNHQSSSHDLQTTPVPTSSRTGRRQFLQAAVATSVGLGTAGVGTASDDSEQTDNGRNGFPPAGITAWGPSVVLGNGTVTTFTTVTPSGKPKYHGVYIERAALEDLPSASALENAGASQYTDKYGVNGEALEIHYNWSQEFFVPFPAAATPVTFLGLNWNPTGHPPFWPDQHFDIHFHLTPMETVDAITGPAAPTYDLPAKYIPAGFERSPVIDERVITDMGEHLVDPTAPEIPEGTFTNTLIWGVADPDDDGTGELTFVEAMITRKALRSHSGIDRRPIAQPATYARAGRYPTAYAVRDVPHEDAIAVTIEAFEPSSEKK